MNHSIRVIRLPRWAWTLTSRSAASIIAIATLAPLAMDGEGVRGFDD